MTKRNEDRVTQLMDVIPERTVEWEEDSEKKLAVLLVPRFRKGLFNKFLQPRLKSPFMRVKLDDIGTFVWKRCDGKKTIMEIGSELESEFGDRVKPIEARISMFFSTLYKSKFVRYWKN